MTLRRTNLVLIMVDNQTPDGLGCYGNAELHTPRIDRLAEEGVRFTQAYCPNSLCSPGRASALTGLLPSQHGVHSWLDDRLVERWPSGWNAIAEFPSLPDVLRRSGYATALVGKYHLGRPDATPDGFAHWVALERGHTLSFFDSPVVKNGQRMIAPGHAVDFLTAEAVAYLEARAGTPEDPFFLFLTYNGPYGHWPAIRGPAGHRFADLYRDCPMNSVPRRGLSQAAIDYVELQRAFGITVKGGPDYHGLLKIPNDLASLRNYFAQISLIDDGVGRVMEALERLHLDESTLVIYIADHGFSLGHHGFWGHSVATWPANAHRIAYNIPLIWRHPGKIPARRRCDSLVGSIALLPTLVDYLGLASEPSLRPRSFAPLLERDETDWEDAVFIDQEETRALRTSRWLSVRRFRGSARWPLGDELYDLAADPFEERNVIDEPASRDVARDMAQRIDDFFARHADPRYDLWHGGAPKSNSSRPWLWSDAWGGGWQPSQA